MNGTPAEIAVRPMTGADLDRVVDIERDSYPSPWNRSHFLDELKSDYSFPMVAVDSEGRMVGYICPRVLLDEGHVLNVAVDRSYRKRGIARLLMLTVLDECRKRGVATLYLEVRASNKAAGALYRHLGFVSTGVRRNYYENGEDAILMEYDYPIERERMQFNSTVLSNIEVSPGYYRMRLSAPAAISGAVPGQFVMIKVRDTIDPLLRRPFGIFDVGAMDSEYPGEPKREYLELLYRVVGKGTNIMSELHHGDHLDLLGPLGRGFDPGPPDSEKILVGGGVGLAPLYYLARELVKDSPVRLFAGGRSRDDIICITEFERLGIETYVSTDDGTLGEQGVVTEVLERRLTGAGSGRMIYACGPFPMLKAVARLADSHGIPCQLSLEAYMACGVGACLGCVIKGCDHTQESPDYRCVCKDGPVFESRELLWE